MKNTASYLALALALALSCAASLALSSVSPPSATASRAANCPAVRKRRFLKKSVKHYSSSNVSQAASISTTSPMCFGTGPISAASGPSSSRKCCPVHETLVSPARIERATY